MFICGVRPHLVRCKIFMAGDDSHGALVDASQPEGGRQARANLSNASGFIANAQIGPQKIVDS